MLRTETLKIGRPKNKPKLKKLTTAQKTTPHKRTGWKMAQVNSVKKSHSEERKEKAVILSSKMCETSKKNSWVDKDLTKRPKKKCFEEHGAV